MEQGFNTIAAKRTPMEEPIFEFLVLGQGLAGSVLAITLLQKNIPCMVVADTAIESASEKAVGLVNPVTGRRMALSWNYSTVFPLAFQFYASAFQTLSPGSPAGSSFLQPFAISKALHTPEEMNFITGKSAWPGYESVFSVSAANGLLPDVFERTVGWCTTQLGARLDVPLFLAKTQAFLKARGLFSNQTFEKEKLVLKAGLWHYGALRAKRVVSCLGLKCPWVGHGLWPVKGQVFALGGMPHLAGHVQRTDKFFVPAEGGLVLAGSTYERGFAHLQTTEAGFEEIVANVKPEIKMGLRIHDSWAGVRPTTPDRRPIIKEIEPGLFALNGLGSKGVTMAPWAVGQVLQQAGFA